MIAHYRDCELQRLESLFREKFRNAAVLDVGCGDGRNIPLMQAAGCAITGVDSNPGQLKGFEDIEVHGIDWLPEPGSFDVVLVSHVIEHLASKELCAFMDKWLTALKAGGSLLVLTPVLGERFYYDFTHIRPYYPQSLRMMFGGIDTARAYSCKWRMELEDIWFFRDPFKWRHVRGFYPASTANRFNKAIVENINNIFLRAYVISKGYFGILASWMGIYKKITS